MSDENGKVQVVGRYLGKFGFTPSMSLDELLRRVQESVTVKEIYVLREKDGVIYSVKIGEVAVEFIPEVEGEAAETEDPEEEEPEPAPQQGPEPDLAAVEALIHAPKRRGPFWKRL